MPQTGADLFVRTMESYGVSRMFGNPGTTELPIMRALQDSDLEYILALHEDVAVGMAAGYAKTRYWHAHDDPSINPLGVVNLHVAPGVAHGLGNMFDSGHIGSGAPLLVTAGAHATDHQHREPNLHGDLVQMTRQFTKWSDEVKHLDALPSMLRRAAHVALTPPTGPVFLSLPLDVMMEATDQSPERLGEIPTAGAGDTTQIDEAADVIAEADDLVMITGDHLARAGPHAVHAAVDLAETTGMRVHDEFRASEVSFPTDHDQYAGGLPDDRETATELLSADVAVFAGVISNVPTNPPDVPDGALPDTTTIHVSNAAWELGKNYVADISVLGDPGEVLAQLADRLADRGTDTQRARRLDVLTEHRANRPASSTPEENTATEEFASNDQLANALATAAPTARVVTEATTSTGALRRHYHFEPGQFYNFRGGGLGYGLPAAIGTALAESGRDTPRDVIGFIGDGAYLYYPNALYTAARYGIDVTIVVPDNRNYRILKNNMLALFGGEEADYEFIGMDFEPPVDIPMNAESQGAAGRLVDDPDTIQGAVEEALAEPGPTVLDVLIHD